MELLTSSVANSQVYPIFGVFRRNGWKSIRFLEFYEKWLEIDSISSLFGKRHFYCVLMRIFRTPFAVFGSIEKRLDATHFYLE